MRTIAALIGVLAAVGLWIGGCGGDSDGDEQVATAELARFAPADSVGFGQVAIRPDGELKETVESILGRFPKGERAGAELIEEIDQELADDDLTYRRDIEPWLGQNAGGFIMRFDVDSQAQPRVAGDEAVILVETTDEELARRVTFDAARRDGRVRSSTYKGIEIVEQYTGANQGSFAVFDGVLAASGGPAGLRAAIDASQGQSLEGNQALDDFLGEREGETMGVGYVDLRPVLDAYQRAKLLTPAQRDQITEGYGVGSDELLAALDLTADQVSFDLAGANPEQSELDPNSELLEDVPDDAWLAFGFGDLGKSLDLGLNQFSVPGAPELSTSRLNRALRRAAGITLEDLESLGDFAAYASGESLFGLEGGAVVEAPDSGEQLLEAIRRGVRSVGEAGIDPLEVPNAEGFSLVPQGIPASINFAFANERLVAAVGEDATERLLEGEGGSEAVSAAQEALGGDEFSVAFLLRFPPIVELVESFGVSDDPDWRQARPYIEQISTLAAGSRVDADQGLVRFVVELGE